MAYEILIAIIIGLFAFVIYLLIKLMQWKFQFRQRVKEWLETEEQRIRQDAISRSARTLSGKTLEKFVPFLEKFPYDPHDIRWLGDPVDLVIFDGYSTKDGIKQVVFCEVKSGNSKLSKIQNRIKELIQSHKVKWAEFKP